MLPHSQAVLKTQLRQAACLSVPAASKARANTPIANNCSHHSD